MKEPEVFEFGVAKYVHASAYDLLKRYYDKMQKRHIGVIGEKCRLLDKYKAENKRLREAIVNSEKANE